MKNIILLFFFYIFLFITTNAFADSCTAGSYRCCVEFTQTCTDIDANLCAPGTPGCDYCTAPYCKNDVWDTGTCGVNSCSPCSMGDGNQRTGCLVISGGMGGGMGGIGQSGYPQPTPTPACTKTWEGPYCDCVNNTAWTYMRQYPYCKDDEYNYTSVIDCGANSCDDSAYSSCSCNPPPGQTPTPTPPTITPPLTPPVTPPLGTPTPTPSIIGDPLTCEQKWGSSVACGTCHEWDPAWTPGATGSCTDHGDGCCEGFPGRPTPPPGCYVGKSCSSSSDCSSGNCSGGICQSCSAPPPGCTPGFVRCNNYKVGKSESRYDNTVSQQQSAVAEFGGGTVPKITISEGDAIFATGSIWEGSGNYEKNFWIYDIVNNLNYYCYERTKSGDIGPYSGPSEYAPSYEYCKNMTDASDRNIRVVDGNTDKTVSQIAEQNQHRRIFRQTGNYKFYYAAQTCNGVDNGSNRCVVDIEVNPLPCRPQFCEALGKCSGSSCQTNNCLNEDGMTTLSRGAFINEIVNYHVNVLKDWTLLTNVPGNQRHFQDVCPNGYDEQNGDGSERCNSPRTYYNQIETAAAHGFLDSIWGAQLSNYKLPTQSGFNSWADSRPIMNAWDDWQWDFRGVGNDTIGYSGDWNNGSYDKLRADNNRVSQDLLRRLMYDYGMSKNHWSCGPTTHTITGYIYVDNNKNGKDDGESPYTDGSISIYQDTGQPITIDQATGRFTINNVPADKGRGYTIRVFNAGLPNGYGSTYPSGLQYNVKPGIPCDASSFRPANTPTKGEGSCLNGNILNLNFGITQSRPWVQFTGLDVRVDGGLINANSSNLPPKTVSNSCTDAKARAVGDTTGYTSISSY